MIIFAKKRKSMLCFWTDISSNLAMEMQLCCMYLKQGGEREKYEKEKKPGKKSLFFHQLKSIKLDFLNDLMCLVSCCQGQLSVLWSDMSSGRKIPPITNISSTPSVKSLIWKSRRRKPKVNFLGGNMMDGTVSAYI